MKNKRGIYWILGTIVICLLFILVLFLIGKDHHGEKFQNAQNPISDNKLPKEENDLIKAQFELGSEIKYENGYFHVQSANKQFLYTEKGKKVEETTDIIEILYDQYYLLKKEGQIILKRNGKEVQEVTEDFQLYKDPESNSYVAPSSLKLDDSLAFYNNENKCKNCFSILYNYETGEIKKEIQGDLLKIELPSKGDIYYVIKGEKITLLKENLEEIGIYTDVKLIENSTYKNISDEYFIVSNKNKWGIIDVEGEEKLPFLYEDILYKANEKKWIIAKKNGKYGIINLENEIIFPFIYNKIELFTNFLLLQNEKNIQILNFEKNILYEKNTEDSLNIIETKGNLLLQWNKEKENLEEKRITFIMKNGEKKEIESASLHYNETIGNYFIIPKIASSIITGFQIYNSDLEYVGLYPISLTKKDYYDITIFQNNMVLKTKNTEEKEVYKVISLNKEAKERYTSEIPIYKVGDYFVIYDKQIVLYSPTFSTEKNIEGISIKQIKENFYQITDGQKVYVYQDER